MKPPVREEAWTYNDFQPGYEFGATHFRIAAERIRSWAEIYGGEDQPHVPPGLLIVEMMKAYLDLVHPRPPGNIHAAQRLHCIDMAVPADAVFTASVCCHEKAQRKGRGWVTFDVTLRTGKRDVLRGEIVTIWAA